MRGFGAGRCLSVTIGKTGKQQVYFRRIERAILITVAGGTSPIAVMR
jgi:hypothetical protein